MNHAPKRPGLIIFAAVIMILAGSWNVLGGICGGGAIALLDAMPKMPHAKGQQDPTALQRFVTKEVPGYYPVIFGMLALTVLLGIAMIAAGIGLLRMSSTARVVAMLLVLISLLISFGGGVYNAVFVLPAQARFVQANPGPEFAMTMPIGIGSLIFGIVLQLAIAIAILVPLNTRSSKAAFVAASQPPQEEEDRPRSRYEGYDDEDDRPSSSSSPDTGFTDRPS
jgi:hypothetical protein